MSENSEITLSKWQLLFRKFEKSIWQSDKASLQTIKVVGTRNQDIDESIRMALAREITMWRNKTTSHYNEKQRRKGLVFRSGQEIQNSSQIESEVNKQLEEILGASTETIVMQNHDLGFTNQVDSSQIELFEIDKNSRLIASIYPLSFRCHKCGHYEIVDPKANNDLLCPCCKKAYCFTCGKENSFNGEECSICGQRINRNELYQFSFVFACPRCANTEELTPRNTKLRNIQGQSIPCQDASKHCSGHMHFMIYGSFQNATWKCETCQYREKVDKHCGCHIAKMKDEELPAIASIMRPTTTSNASIMRPLIKSYLYMGTSVVTLDGLLSHHNKFKSIDQASWNLTDEFPEMDLQVIKEQYGLVNAFTVPDITTLTLVYGYTSGIQSFPTRISDDERMAQLFKSGHKYYGYFVRTTGRGLVIVLNKEKILHILKKSDLQFTNYQELVTRTKNEMESGELQKIIDNTNSVPLMSLLHGIEHALIKTLMDQTGLDDFGSKVMLNDCCIVLYEREDLGSGGLIQLTRNGQGSEFKKFLVTSEKYLRICPQLCDKGCLACIFINDFQCQPYVPSEIVRWFPPNSILDRNLSKDFFNIK